ncbi:hypothetical protein [Gandjariella thermophila]|uniref:hypothetical protein n=1 Tax=Gandjariella thermophila TaxID=1931992 RepID=UPI0010F84618|nr:hypothetical protein [Gandjariella thermophila]
MTSPSATLVVWTSAWLHGVVGADDVLDALRTWAEQHEVVANDHGTATALDLPGPEETPSGPAMLLAALRRAGAAEARLVLPVPGDVRGLGGGGPFTDAALRAGNAVVLQDIGVGVVPHPVAEGILRWTLFDLPAGPPPEYVPLGEAEHGLAGAMRDAAATLHALDVASNRPGARAEINALVRSAPRPPWPQGMPGRSLRVLQRAAEVAAILEVAMGDEPGGALSASAATARSEALRPLGDAVRRARCAAVDEAVRVLSDRAGQH